MYHVVLEKFCGCAKRARMPQIKSFDDKKSAEELAIIWANQMNEKFCSKHSFSVFEVDDNYVIAVE